VAGGFSENLPAWQHLPPAGLMCLLLFWQVKIDICLWSRVATLFLTRKNLVNKSDAYVNQIPELFGCCYAMKSAVAGKNAFRNTGLGLKKSAVLHSVNRAVEGRHCLSFAYAWKISGRVRTAHE
jgi:hypothetical protein